MLEMYPVAMKAHDLRHLDHPRGQEGHHDVENAGGEEDGALKLPFSDRIGVAPVALLQSLGQIPVSVGKSESLTHALHDYFVLREKVLFEDVIPSSRP